MKLVHSQDVEAKPVAEDGATNTTIRWLLSRPEGAPNFAMRLFELAPGGTTPLHTHDWEHEVYILEGAGEVVTADGPQAMAAGDAILVVPNELHQFRNTQDTTLRLICLVPLSAVR